jgi:putative RecB family exonuclease
MTAASTVELPIPVVGSLSPTRASDFKTCPLLYRFRAIDRIPERPTADQARGTVVHAVLDRLFDLPAEQRTFQAAADLVEPEWRRLVEAEPELAALFAGAGQTTAGQTTAGQTTAGQTTAGQTTAGQTTAGQTTDGQTTDGAARPVLADWLASARSLLAGYFALEDPRRLEPAARELLVEVVLDSGLLLRGYVDRLDVAPTGEIRVVDYKSGGIPREAYETQALFQLKFYALVLWKTRGTVPRQLRLMYLGDRDTLSYVPDPDELTRFERNLLALWRAIERAKANEDFRPSPSRLCAWCDHRPRCPAHGGTPPPYPRDAAAAVPESADLGAEGRLGTPPDQ